MGGRTGAPDFNGKEFIPPSIDIDNSLWIKYNFHLKGGKRQREGKACFM
jgi:hypothetical protein